MAAITRVNPSPDASTAMFCRQVTGLLAGEAITVGQACYIASTGRVMLADGGAADAEAVFVGLAANTVAAGQPVTLLGAGCRWKYATGLTPGASYYVSATDGALDTAATTGGTVAVAFAIDTTDIMVIG